MFEKLGRSIQENSCIIVTHCENVLAKENGKELMMSKVDNSEILKIYKEKVNNKIYFLGFPDKKDIINTDLLNFYNKCHDEFREELLTFISEAEKNVSKYDIESVIKYLKAYIAGNDKKEGFMYSIGVSAGVLMLGVIGAIVLKK